MLPSAAAPNRKKENDLKSLYLLKEKKKERNVSLLYIYISTPERTCIYPDGRYGVVEMIVIASSHEHSVGTRALERVRHHF